MQAGIRSVRDLDVRGKRVLLRDDLNLPMRDGKVSDETRLIAALPTIQLLIERGARIIICSHLGRPKGAADESLSLRPVAALLAERLGIPVGFAADCIGAPARDAADALRDGEVLLLENLRFHEQEEKNNPTFAKALASLADFYVNDAFGAAHRAHASTEGVTKFITSVAGLLLEAEIDTLGTLMQGAARPYICAIGGAKVTDKLRVLTSLIEKVDGFVVGGGMANTFLAAQGYNMGRSMRDPDLTAAKEILALVQEKQLALHLPVDGISAPSFHDDDRAHVTTLDEIGDGMVLDIGPATSKIYADVLRTAKTIIFNGPMGVYEKAPYREGTRVIAQAIADATKAGAMTVVGGGDAAAAAHMLGFEDAFTHVSTGGGAMLEYLEGVTLPGVAALVTAVHAG